MAILSRCRLQSSWKDVKNEQFWRGVIGEFIGTMMFLFIGVGGVLFMNLPLGTTSGVHIGLAIGLTLATVIWCMANVSGGHINPAVSFACLVTRRISLAKFLIYVLVQAVGAIIGVSLLKAVSPDFMALKGYGATLISPSISVGQGFVIEILITFMLVLTVFATCDSSRNDLKGSGPLAIGIAVVVGHLFALNYTGASMNPARSIGSAAVQNNWTDHWVYWLAPFIGGLLAGILYDLVFAANTSLARIKSWLCHADYNPEKTVQVCATAEDEEHEV